MAVEGDGFAMVPDTSFAPHYSSPSWGVLRIDNGGHLGKFLSAELKHDTTCSICSCGFTEGEKLTAHLAGNPAEAVWEHNACAALGVGEPK